MNLSHKSKKIIRVVNTFRTWNGPPKFCIDLEADWLIILDEIRWKSSGFGAESQALTQYGKLSWQYRNFRTQYRNTLIKENLANFIDNKNIPSAGSCTNMANMIHAMAQTTPGHEYSAHSAVMAFKNRREHPMLSKFGTDSTN